MRKPPEIVFEPEVVDFSQEESIELKTWTQLTPATQRFMISEWLNGTWDTVAEFARSQYLDYKSILHVFKSLGLIDQKKNIDYVRVTGHLDAVQEKACESAMLSVEVTKRASIGMMDIMQSCSELTLGDFWMIQERAAANAVRMGYVVESISRSAVMRSGGTPDVLDVPKLDVPAEVTNLLKQKYSDFGQLVVRDKENSDE